MKKIIFTIFFIFACSLAALCEPNIPDAVKNLYGDEYKFYYVIDWKKYEIYYPVWKRAVKGAAYTAYPQFILYNPKTNKARRLDGSKKEYDEALIHIKHHGYPERPRQESKD